MKKQINLHGIEFELLGTTHRNVVKQRSLYDVYANPSNTKRVIWYNWSRWFRDNGIWEYGVSSYSCYFFSINAIEQNYFGKSYMLVITPNHNKAYEIV